MTPKPPVLSRQALTAKEREAYSRLHWLLNQPGVLRGNLVETRLRCGKKECHCADHPKARHRALLLMISIDGRRQTIYVPASWEERVREWVNRHGEIRKVLERLSRGFLVRLKNRDRDGP